jgi:hypothetical protein
VAFVSPAGGNPLRLAHGNRKPSQDCRIADIFQNRFGSFRNCVLPFFSSVLSSYQRDNETDLAHWEPQGRTDIPYFRFFYFPPQFFYFRIFPFFDFLLSH